MESQRNQRRIKKIEEQLSQPHVDLDKLKEAVWSGIPSCKSLPLNLNSLRIDAPELRAEAWKLLSDYIPVD